jgi:hypothetical protein
VSHSYPAVTPISFQSDFFLSIAMVKFNFELLNSTADVMHMASTQESGNELSVDNDSESEEDHERRSHDIR